VPYIRSKTGTCKHILTKLCRSQNTADMMVSAIILVLVR